MRYHVVAVQSRVCREDFSPQHNAVMPRGIPIYPQDANNASVHYRNFSRVFSATKIVFCHSYVSNVGGGQKRRPFYIYNYSYSHTQKII